jgi:hypothetical protein
MINFTDLLHSIDNQYDILILGEQTPEEKTAGWLQLRADCITAKRFLLSHAQNFTPISQAIHGQHLAHLLFAAQAYRECEKCIAWVIAAEETPESILADLRQLYLQTLKALKKQAAATKKAAQTAKPRTSKPRKKVGKKKNVGVI